MKIKAAVIEEKDQEFRIVDMELAPPKYGEVLVKVTACGVCHTDDVARRQLIAVPLPAVFGHEGCGVIQELGPGVTGFKPGDRVGFSFGYCGECEACRTGHPYGCRENRRLNFGGVQFDGTKRIRYKGQEVSSFFGQGAFATYAVVHQNNLIHADEDMPLELVAPMGCGIQTGAGAIFNYLRPQPDSSVIITGCGPVGLSAVMAARIAGCTTIIACDIVDSRLDLALEMGATHVINSRKVASVPEEAKALTGGLGCHYAVDCTGIGECVRASLNCTRPLGVCAVVGATQELTINVENELMGTAKTLGGVVEGCCIPQLFIPKLISYYKRGQFPFDKMVKFYKFSEINQAFADTKSGQVIKAVLLMDED
ncbi:MAG: NAD(P)-dependent alcohol dehydrogenase [Oscillospiraceae bacterium]